VNLFCKNKRIFTIFSKIFAKTQNGALLQNLKKTFLFQPYLSRVPAEERAYLRDQRSKIGSSGNLQMGKVGPLTAARKPAARTNGRKSNPKRSQPLEQVFVNPDITYEVRNK
jgi:hypothetical protein